jgi:hypothetical protein
MAWIPVQAVICLVVSGPPRAVVFAPSQLLTITGAAGRLGRDHLPAGGQRVWVAGCWPGWMSG